MVQISRSGTIRAKFNSEFCIEGPLCAVQKIHRFEFRRRSYLVLARKNGFVQLFESERHYHGSPTTKISFKLFKEWKNACISALDSIVLVGVAHGRYLYSCSAEGKLIFRDLLHDDSDASNRIFLVQKPVSTVEVSDLEAGVVLVVCAGKSNPVKKYSVDLAHDQQQHGVKRSDICCTIVGHAGTNWWAGDVASGSEWNYAVPLWCVHGNDQWIVSTASVEKDIYCGSQNGSVLRFTEGSNEVTQEVSLSHFPIRGLVVHDLYLICHDTMSRVTVLDRDLTIVRQYDGLKIGPVSSFKFVFEPEQDRRRRAVHSPNFHFFVVTTNLENRMVVYKLGSLLEMVLNMELHSGAPCFELLGQGSCYSMLQEICGHEPVAAPTRRKYGIWQPLGTIGSVTSQAFLPTKTAHYELRDTR